MAQRQVDLRNMMRNVGLFRGPALPDHYIPKYYRPEWFSAYHLNQLYFVIWDLPLVNEANYADIYDIVWKYWTSIRTHMNETRNFGLSS